MTSDPGFKVIDYLQVEYFTDGARLFVFYNNYCRSPGTLSKTCKNKGSSLKISRYKGLKFFRWVMEINSYIHIDIQLIREKFWLQFWTVTKFSQPRVSQNYATKK